MAESLKGSFGFTIGERKQYSSTDIDYKSVKQQSGIFAGDQGFDVTVKGNTNLIGAVIAGSQKSINDGVNQLTTGTLTTSDLKNKANYDATSTGMSGGYGGSKVDPKTGQLSPNGVATSNTWNNINVSRPSVMGAHDSSNSTTYSGVSGGKITITDSFGQSMITGKTAEQAINELNRGVATGVDQSNALEKIYDEASIKASFNITKQLNTEVGIFQANRAQNATTIKEMEEKGLDKLTKEERAQYDNAKKAMGDSDLWALGGKGTLVLNAISLAANGNVTGSGADLIRGSAVNYLQGLTAQQIKSIADALQSESARAALHAISACAGAAAKQGDCGSAALGAGASVLLNNMLDDLLKTNADDMTSAEKDTRVNLITSIIAGITQAAGGDAAMANAGSRIEMENNYFSENQKLEYGAELAACAGNLFCEAKVNSKWGLIGAGQSYAFGIGMVGGVGASINDGIYGLIKIVQSPIESYYAIKVILSDEDFWENVPASIKQSYVNRLNNLEAEYQKAGLDGSFNAGVESGKLLFEVYGTVTGINGATKVPKMLASIKIAKAEKLFVKFGDVPEIGVKIRSAQVGLKDPAYIDVVKKKMIEGTYDYTNKDNIIAGWVDNKGSYVIGEGNHRMNAALEIYKQTGDASHIQNLLRNGLWTENLPNRVLPMPHR